MVTYTVTEGPKAVVGGTEEGPSPWEGMWKLSWKGNPFILKDKLDIRWVKKREESVEKHCRHGNSMNGSSEALESPVCSGSWVVEIFLSSTPAFLPSPFGRVSPSKMVSTALLDVPA